ncbi:MAG: FxsC protein [Trebonia sp.]
MVMEAPYFFLSYAHSPQYDGGRQGGGTTVDPDVWAATLFSDLCAHVGSLTTMPPGTPAGFMPCGQWPGLDRQAGLAQALGNCRVFVPLYSRRYFQSEHCGKEWSAFSRRPRAHQHHDRAPAIVPALWGPVETPELPSAARSIDVDHAGLGDMYAQRGFYGIMKLTRYRTEYEQAVRGLARRIVDAAWHSPAEPDRALDYDSLPSAFGQGTGETPGHQRLRVTIVAPSQGELPEDRSAYHYGTVARDWDPYRPLSSRALADHVVDLVRGLGYRPDVGDLHEHGAELLGSGPPSGPQVLIVDAWATRQCAYRDLLARLDAMNKPWVQVLIPWNRQDEENAAQEACLRDALAAALRRKLAEGRVTSSLAVRGVPTLEDFRRVLPAVITAAVRHYFRYAPACPSLAASAKRPRLGAGTGDLAALGRAGAPPTMRHPLGALFAGEAVEGLPGAALGGLRVAGAHPGPREFGSRLGEPLL